jgi:hypothetical protein
MMDGNDDDEDCDDDLPISGRFPSDVCDCD